MVSYLQTEGVGFEPTVRLFRRTAV